MQTENGWKRMWNPAQNPPNQKPTKMRIRNHKMLQMKLPPSPPAPPLPLPAIAFVFLLGCQVAPPCRERTENKGKQLAIALQLLFDSLDIAVKAGQIYFRNIYFWYRFDRVLLIHFNKTESRLLWFFLFLFFDIVSSLVGGHVWSSMCIQGDAPSFMVVQKEPNISGVACRFTDVSLVHYQRFRSVPTIQLDFW